ncbi:UNVERIFIED_CONTAM: hypothetical protein FKN15_029298 [Acipenser sinensis]
MLETSTGPRPSELTGKYLRTRMLDLEPWDNAPTHWLYSIVVIPATTGRTARSTVQQDGVNCVNTFGMDEGGAQASIAQEGGAQASIAQEGGAQASIAQEGGAQASIAQEGGAQASIAQEGGAQASIAQEGGAQASIAQEGGARGRAAPVSTDRSSFTATAGVCHAERSMDTASASTTPGGCHPALSIAFAGGPACLPHHLQWDNCMCL